MEKYGGRDQDEHDQKAVLDKILTSLRAQQRLQSMHRPSIYITDITIG